MKNPDIPIILLPLFLTDLAKIYLPETLLLGGFLE